ncbi:MAG: CheY-like chemotaxis protein [Polyangiales bacterium]|jgi:CheY-like chemotaxis protein
MSRRSLPNFILVEDNEDHAVLVRKTLASEEIANKLTVFGDAESALEHLRDPQTATPQVILLDINLPEMTGLELLKVLKSDGRLKTIPVVMLSTSEAEVDRLKAYEYAANSYLTKPVDFQNFRKMIKDVGHYWGVWNRPSS